MITVAIIIATTQVPTTFVELAATNVEMTTTTATTIIGAAKTTVTATDTARRVSKNPASGAKGYIKKTKPKGGPALVGLINDTTLRHSSNWHDPRFLSRSFTPAHARTHTYTHAQKGQTHTLFSFYLPLSHFRCRNMQTLLNRVARIGFHNQSSLPTFHSIL